MTSGQAHRDDRAEGEQQDDHRRQQADHERGVAFFFGAGFLDRLAAEVDLEAAAVRRLGLVDQLLGVLFFEFVGEDVVLDGGVGDLAVLADRRRAAALVGAGDFADVGERFGFGEEVLASVRLTAGDSTPSSALKTIVVVSPDWAGNLVSSRSKASVESEAGSLKSSEKSEPTEPAIMPTPIRATIQLRITVLRCPVHQVAKRLIERRTVANDAVRLRALPHSVPLQSGG